jgi:hypothetical protein
MIISWAMILRTLHVEDFHQLTLDLAGHFLANGKRSNVVEWYTGLVQPFILFTDVWTGEA